MTGKKYSKKEIVEYLKERKELIRNAVDYCKKEFKQELNPAFEEGLHYFITRLLLAAQISSLGEKGTEIDKLTDELMELLS